MRTNRTESGAAGLLILLGIAAAGCASSGAEAADEPSPVFTESTAPSGGAVGGDLREGAELVVRLDRPLSSDESEAGDPWQSEVVHEVRDRTGVVVPRGSIIAGVVTRAGPMEIEGETRQVIALEPRTLIVEGREYPIRAEIVDAEFREHDTKVTTENIAIVGGSTVAGAILGEILLDNALLGAVLGAAGGTVVAVATEETEIELDRGSQLTLRLQERVAVAQRR